MSDPADTTRFPLQLLLGLTVERPIYRRITDPDARHAYPAEDHNGISLTVTTGARGLLA